MFLRTPYCSAKEAAIIRARFSLMPLSCLSRSTSVMASRVSSPKALTSRRAVASPTPLIRPEERKRSMPSREVGFRIWQPEHLNCRP